MVNEGEENTLRRLTRSLWWIWRPRWIASERFFNSSDPALLIVIVRQIIHQPSKHSIQAFERLFKPI